MAEPRIIHPTPMGPAGPKKKMEKVPKTLRFDLTLNEPTNLTCTEYSYLELLKKAADNDEEKLKECMDPFAQQDLEEQKKLEEMAKSFESRYGPKLSKKKRKVQIQDLIDLGDGYDDTDPFVDNSEAYDELVPATLTTKLGGFYINTGVLDFREVMDSDGDFQSPKKKKKKMRVIASDSDSSISTASSIAKKKKSLLVKKKRKDGEIVREKKRKKLMLSSGDEKPLLKKKKIPKDKEQSSKKNPPNMADLLKQISPPEKKQTTMNGTASVTGTPAVKKNGDSVFSTIDAVINQTMGDSLDSDGRGTPTFNTPDMNHETATPNLNSDTFTPQLNQESCTPNPESAPPLPSGIPRPLEDIITKIKVAAAESQHGKAKFFNPAVNRMLLVIEKESRQLACSQRSGIYNHLAAFLPCSKDTLLKRAKKLRLNEQDNKVRDPINKLKEAVIKVMPAYIEQYTQECKAASHAKAGEKTEGKEDAGSSDSDDDNKDEKKKSTGPRKRFTWTNEIRDLLCDVVRTKMMSYEMSKMRTQSAEEYLKTFLDTEIKPIWPKGWMQTRLLYKESRSAHSPYTVNAPKARKNIAIPGRIVSSASNTPVPVNSLMNSTPSGVQRQPNKSLQKSTDNGLDNLLTLLDYAEESGQKDEVNDTASALSSFLESEAASEMLMSIADNHVPTMPDIEKDIPIVTARPKGAASNSRGASDTSFMAQFQKFTGTYKPNSQDVNKVPSSVKTEIKKVAPHIGLPSQDRDLPKIGGTTMVAKPGSSSSIGNIGQMLPGTLGLNELNQLSPPRGTYLNNPKTLQRSLSCEASAISKKPPPSVPHGLASPPSIHGSPDSHIRTGASTLRREPVKSNLPSPIGLFPPGHTSDIPSIYSHAQAIANMAEMNSHLANLSGHVPQPKQVRNALDFKLPQTSDYPHSLKSPDLLMDGGGFSKQHQQFLQQVATMTQHSTAHLINSSGSGLAKPSSPAVWGSSKTSPQTHFSTPGFNVPMSRISPTNSISSGMPAGYKSISLLDQGKDASLVHQGLQISRASTDPMRGPGTFGHHSPGSSNHSPIGPISPHGHSPKGLYPPLAHNNSPRHTMPNSPFPGLYQADKSRSPHGY